MCVGVHMYTDSNSLDPSSRVIWGPFYFLFASFFLRLFFSFLFFTILVLLCVFGWVHPCSSHVTRTGGILCLYWPRLETRKDPVLFFLFSFWENNKKKREDPKKKKKKLKGKKKTSWLKEQLQTRTSNWTAEYTHWQENGARLLLS